MVDNPKSIPTYSVQAISFRFFIAINKAIVVQIHLKIPTLRGQRVGNGKPIPVDFKISRFAELIQ